MKAVCLHSAHVERWFARWDIRLHCAHVYDWVNQLPKSPYRAVPFTNPKPVPPPCGEDYKPWID